MCITAKVNPYPTLAIIVQILAILCRTYRYPALPLAPLASVSRLPLPASSTPSNPTRDMVPRHDGYDNPNSHQEPKQRGRQDPNHIPLVIPLNNGSYWDLHRLFGSGTSRVWRSHPESIAVVRRDGRDSETILDRTLVRYSSKGWHPMTWKQGRELCWRKADDVAILMVWQSWALRQKTFHIQDRPPDVLRPSTQA